MKILLVGGGGREHALAWKISRSPLLSRLVCAPGNPGMARLAEIRGVAVTDVAGQVALAGGMAADLVVVGPEAALEAGIADAMAAAGIACFGPTAAAARIETSKAFAKAFAARYGLPTGAFAVFEDAGAAKAYLGARTPPFVIKADGLAAGKGVTVAASLAEAEAAVDACLGGQFGAAGARVIIEDFLDGEIVSVFALSDGATVIPFGAAQDHKRIGDGDVGPNTGGMGAYAPAPVASPAVVEAVMDRLIAPAMAGLAAEGCPFRGVVFCEVMVTAEGPMLVEFNARFGDPECQVLMLQLESDLVPYLAAAAGGTLASLPAPAWSGEAAVCVVMAAAGYPQAPEAGAAIRGAARDFGPAVTVFNAGAGARDDGSLFAAGGRVLNICARGADVREAADRAYGALSGIEFPGALFRTDIGWRARA